MKLYQKILFLCVIAVRLSAADDELITPETIDGLPSYCAEFVRHMLHHYPLRRSRNLFQRSCKLSMSDKWEDNVNFFLEKWNDMRVNDVLLSIAESYAKKDAMEIVSMSDQERTGLFEKAKRDVQEEWKEVVLKVDPQKIDPEAYRFFLNDTNLSYQQFQYIRFAIIRLGMCKEQACLRMQINENKKKIVLAIHKESYAEFQEKCKFNLCQEE